MTGGLPAYVLRRLLVAIPLLLVISLGVFALVNIAPGDPARSLLGSRQASPETLAAIREQYHLDEPFVVQYLIWLRQVLTWDLGRSIQGSQLVTTMIWQRLPLTVFLGLYGSLIALGIGIPLGVLAAYRHGSDVDRGVVTIGVIGVSAPAFATGIFLLYVFGVYLGWFPIFGQGEGFLDQLWHLTLPAIALGSHGHGARDQDHARLDDRGARRRTTWRSRGLAASRAGGSRLRTSCATP